MSETIDIVITTINSGSFLEHYADTLAESGARLVVIPDRKTPRAFYEACEKARGAAPPSSPPMWRSRTGCWPSSVCPT